MLKNTEAKDPVYAELCSIGHENLIKEAKTYRKTSLYTYPTFPALVFLQKKIAEEEIPFIIKIKILNKDGVIGILSKTVGNVKEGDPILVFEGIGTDGSINVPTFR